MDNDRPLFLCFCHCNNLKLITVLSILPTTGFETGSSTYLVSKVNCSDKCAKTTAHSY